MTDRIVPESREIAFEVVTPTWYAVLPLLLTAYRDGTGEGRRMAVAYVAAAQKEGVPL